MDKHQIASLGCKFLGIYALLESIPLFGNIFQIYVLAKGESAFGIAVVLSTAVPFMLMIACAAALILFSNRFADKMIDCKSDESSNQGVSLEDIQAVAFSIAGLVLLVLSLPKMVQIGWNIYALKAVGNQRHAAEILKNTWSIALAAGLQFIIGLVLFIGAALLAKVWHKTVRRLR
jgi:hypothetical protein